jgi:hypothetical protein
MQKLTHDKILKNDVIYSLSFMQIIGGGGYKHW